MLCLEILSDLFKVNIKSNLKLHFLTLTLLLILQIIAIMFEYIVIMFE